MSTTLEAINVGRITPRMVWTNAKPLVFDRTLLLVNITPGDEYTDEQFHADLKKASKKLKAMAARASKEHAEGKTEKFPE